MGNHFLIRNAKEEDIPHIHSLLKKTGLYFAPVDKHESYEQQLKSGPGSIIVAERDGMIIGMVIVIFSPIASVIAHLAVLPAYRRRRLAMSLLREAFQYIRRRGGSYVAGYIEQENVASINLFKSIGAKEYETPLTAMFKEL